VSGTKRIPSALAFVFFASFALLCNPLSTCAQSHTSAREFLSGGSRMVAVGDFNHDGNEDVAMANFGPAVSVPLGNGDGTFRAAVNYPIGTVLPADIAAADFNGGGKLDLAVTDRSGTLNIPLGNGDGTFQPPLRFTLPSRFQPGPVLNRRAE
jgi:FG-GAP-like repeat